MTDDTHIIPFDDGREVELTTSQLLDLNAGALNWLPLHDHILVDDDGTITERQSAVPEQHDTPPNS